jgi:TonB family protein
MQKEKKDKHFVKKPTYKGGTKALKQFVKQELKYPAKALAAKVEGTVSLSYTIDYKGKVVAVKVVSGLGYGCNEEAERIVRMLKFEVPKTRKLRVQFHKTIQIHFRLPKKKPSPSATIQYTVTSSSTTPEEQPKDNGGYSYTIQWGDS